MAIQYVTRQDTRKGSAKLWYGRAVHPSTIDLTALADRVQRQCSMTKGDVLAVLTELITVMKDELQNSNKVKLDGLGTFSIGIKTSGAATEEEFKANDHVKGFRVNFLSEGRKVNGRMTRTFIDGCTVVKASGSNKPTPTT